MSESPEEDLRYALRSRRGRRRVVYVEPETQPDEEFTDHTYIRQNTDSTYEDGMSQDSDETHFSDSSESEVQPRSPSYSPPPHLSNDSLQARTPGSPASTRPGSRSNSPDVVLLSPSPHSPHSPVHPPHSPVHPPHTPVYSPHTPVYSPHSPDYPPSDEEADVQIIEPHSSGGQSAVIPQAREAVAEQPVTQPGQPPDRLVPEPEEPQRNSAPPPAEPKPKLETKASEKTVALNCSVQSDCDDNSLCTICMDPLTNSGKHRVVCLKCGHIFGQSCVERWIKVGCTGGARRCPTCNVKASLKDVRVLFLPKVVPLDTVERDRLILEKEQLATQNKILESDLSKAKLQNDMLAKMYEQRVKQLEKELLEATTAVELMSQGKKVVPRAVELRRDQVQSELLHMVEISKEKGCRVLAFNPLLHELVVSQPSTNAVFSGFGVRVLSTVDFLPSRFVFLHSKMIRDLAFHAEDSGLLLSVSLDQTAKLVDMMSNTNVHTFKGEGPLWSCCWEAHNPHLLLVGSQLGKVCQYDRRMLGHYVNSWENKSNQTPVVALASAPSLASSPFPQGGFLSCRLNGVFAYARDGETYRTQELPLEGPFMSMRYNFTSQNLLTASRPSSRCPYAKVNLNLVDVDAKGNICLPQIHSFNCGSSASVMSRMTTLPMVNDTLVAAHHESGRTVTLWSMKTGDPVHKIVVKEPVIDLACLTASSNKCLLATLSEKRVGIYKIA